MTKWLIAALLLCGSAASAQVTAATVCVILQNNTVAAEVPCGETDNPPQTSLTDADARVIAFRAGTTSIQLAAKRSLLPGMLGRLDGADMTSTADQIVKIRSVAARYKIDEIMVTGCSAAPTAAVGGIYNQAAKAGVAIVPATQAYSGVVLGAASGYIDATLSVTASNHTLAAPQLFLHLDTAAASGTCDFIVFGRDIPG